MKVIQIVPQEGLALYATLVKKDTRVRKTGTSAEKSLAANTMLGVVGLDTWLVLNPLIVLDHLGRDAIGQVGRQ